MSITVCSELVYLFVVGPLDGIIRVANLYAHSLLVSADPQGQSDNPLVVRNRKLELSPCSCDHHPALQLLVDISVKVDALVLVVHVEDLVEVEAK